MRKDFSRTDRVGQQLHKEIASILQQELKHREPQLGMVTLSEVEVSRDLSHAKVFVTFYSDDEQHNKNDMKILKDNAGFVRSLLAKRIRMRMTPAVHFHRDSSITEGVRISTLVDKAIKEDEEKSKK